MRYLSFAILLVASLCSAAAAAEPMKILATWAGMPKDGALKRLAPRTGFFAEEESFAKAWRAWLPGDEVPEVDFDAELVLVGTVPGPNYVLMQPNRDDRGRVSFTVAGTKRGGPGFGFKMQKVARRGVTAVNGNRLAADTDDDDDELPEYIKVEVKGKLTHGVFAIGGETTGTTITANGVTWELDLGGDAELRRRAEELNEKTVVVTGQLHVKAGVEIRKRWIVSVATLKAPRPGGAGGGNPYVDDKGHLRKTLIFKDSQGGFAGFSGHIWTLEPNGTWKRQPFLNRNVREADQKGMLSDKNLAAVAQALADKDLLALPKELGTKPGVNPHIFSVTFGDHETSLFGRGGSPVPAPDPRNPNTPVQRFAAILRVLQKAMTPPPEPE